MKRVSQYIFPLTLGVVIGISISIGSNVMANRADAEERNTLPLNELRTFSEVFAKVKESYVEEVNDKDMIESAIRGMLSSLDPHSNFLNIEEFTELKVGTTGEFGGLGIEVTMEDGFVKVVSPIDDTPAFRAGVQAGDLVIRLDETPVKGMTLNDAVKIMRGKPGIDIDLTIIREGEEKPLNIVITRDIIKITSVKNRILEKGFGYLRVTSFQTRTTEQVREAIEKMQKEEEGKLNGLVLDLRNNPGGVLNAAVGVSDLFIEKGKIVYTEGREGDSKLNFNAKPGDILNGIPIVVLVNGGSASASEIVAGALQDHSRAVIMGSKSFGKGSVQTIYPMSSKTAVKITTARYFTPSGRSIQAEGIKPDIEVAPVKVSKVEKSKSTRISEADLNGHLSNGNSEKDSEKKSNNKGEEETDTAELASKDYTLNEALNLLKGLHILGKR